MKLFTSFILLIFISIVSFAQITINIPADYATIQEGLNAADEGDIVQVAPGTYYENIIWPNKNGIILIGESKDNTIVDGSNLSATIFMNPLNIVINDSTIIKNLSIESGGNSINGGGFLIVNASPVLENLLVKNNSAQRGGGLYLKNSNALIRNCEISNNNTTSSQGEINEGGGIYVTSGTPNLINTTISNNKSYRGAGVSLLDGNIEIDSSLFFINMAEQNGGAIYLTGNSSCNVLNSTIKENRAPNLGGGICNYGGLCLVDSTILDNNFSYNGAGIYDSFSSNKTTVQNSFILNHSGAVLGAAILSDHNLEVQNTIIAYNYANAEANPNSKGGGICGEFHANITLNKVSFINNIALKSGGALSVSENSNLIIEDCTFSNNSSKNGDAIYVNVLGNYSITNNIFFKNGFALFNNDNTVYIEAANNFWGDSSGPYNSISNVDGKGDEVSSLVNFSPWLSSYPLDAPIYPVQNILVKSTSDNSISLLWDGINIEDLAGYKIYYDIESTDWEFRNSVDVGLDTTYTLTNLEIGKTYYLSVTCYDNDGNESWFSETIAAKTTPAPIIETNLTEINFGKSVINKEKNVELLISNTGTEVLTVYSSETSTSDFYPDQNIELNIAPSESKMLSILFNPTLVGAKNDILIIRSNAVNYPELAIPLIGEGVLSDAPVIISIDDVPEDQGGQVRINFQSSRYEGSDTDSSIQSYSVWRQIKDSNEWDAVGLFNAIQEPFYYYVAPTIGDSTVHNLIWSKFKISAHTSNPNIFYMSDPDSGYSIDNIAPEAPSGLNANSINGIVVELSWKANLEKDFAYYAIYRGNNENFVADSASLLSTTTDSVYSDSEILNGTYYYKISAFDYSGNESELSSIADVLVGVDDQNIIPKDYAINQNFPNPFNPSTLIKFSIPELSNVRVMVYNALGEFVMNLVDKEFTTGHHETKWNAENQPSGIYFIKIEAESIISDKHYSNTIKAILLK